MIKRKPGSLVKEIYLKDKDVSYRLALEKFNYNPHNIPIQEYYESLKTIKPIRDRYFFWCLFSYSLLTLVYFGAIRSIESYGVTLDNSVFLAVSLLLTSISGLLFANSQNKLYKYDSIFSYMFEKACHSQRQDLLLRYPEAYSVLQYNPFMVSNPIHTFWKKDFPIRFIALAISILIVIIIYLILWICLLYSVGYELWFNSPNEWELINRSILLSTAALYAVSMLLHNSGTGRTKYEHYGLINLLEKLKKRDVNRYNLRINQINIAHKNLFGTEIFK